MKTGRTFGTKLAGGFAVTLALTVLMAATSVAALRIVVDASRTLVASTTGSLLGAQRLSTAMESRAASFRGYLITGTPGELDQSNRDRRVFLEQVARLRDTLDDPPARRLLDTITAAEATHAAALTPLVEKRRTLHDLTEVSQLLPAEVVAARQAVQDGIAALIERVRTVVETARDRAARRATQATLIIVVLGGLAVAGGAAIAWRLSRDLRRQIGAAVGHIQSSSAQLEATAAHQASGGRDQASALSEITNTISELLITSRQIAENAQRVSKVAQDTETAARHGDAAIDATRASITAIRAQVDQIVRHMLALGQKSQQIGGVVDLVSELAEQTNILAINATIEATGAGEWGRRFAVVAAEIRTLADRTAGSARQIRTLIDDVRGAVDTTVTATESGANAVDAGARRFDDAARSLHDIVELVATTNDATREIELSTKQQSSAVEQVSVAACDTARVSRETEAGAVQAKQTAAHLATLSSDLLDLVGSGRH